MYRRTGERERERDRERERERERGRERDGAREQTEASWSTDKIPGRWPHSQEEYTEAQMLSFIELVCPFMFTLALRKHRLVIAEMRRRMK